MTETLIATPVETKPRLKASRFEDPLLAMSLTPKPIAIFA